MHTSISAYYMAAAEELLRRAEPAVPCQRRASEMFVGEDEEEDDLGL